MILTNAASAGAARVAAASPRILVVEDNIAFAELLGEHLRRAGFACTRAASVAEARGALSAAAYSAIVVDPRLAELDGHALLDEIRSHGDATPVLIASARNRLTDRVDALRGGADDYLTKPFAMDELVERLNAVLRRPSKAVERVLSVGNVALDSESGHLTIDSKAQSLRPQKIAILELLMRHRGTTVPRRMVDDLLSGTDDERGPDTLDAYVHRLRAHLADAGATVRIQIFRGVGYLMSEVNWTQFPGPDR